MGTGPGHHVEVQVIARVSYTGPVRLGEGSDKMQGGVGAQAKTGGEVAEREKGKGKGMKLDQ